MHDRPAIRADREAGASIRSIARGRGASRNAVRRALAPGSRDRYYRRSVTEDAEEAVRDVLADYPHMAARDVAVLIDWEHSYRLLALLVARLRPEYVGEPAMRSRPLSSLRRGTVGTAGKIRTGRLSYGQARVG